MFNSHAGIHVNVCVSLSLSKFVWVTFGQQMQSDILSLSLSKFVWVALGQQMQSDIAVTKSDSKCSHF